jgi:hypothetical protein
MQKLDKGLHLVVIMTNQTESIHIANIITQEISGIFQIGTATIKDTTDPINEMTIQDSEMKINIEILKDMIVIGETKGEIQKIPLKIPGSITAEMIPIFHLGLIITVHTILTEMTKKSLTNNGLVLIMTNQIWHYHQNKMKKREFKNHHPASMCSSTPNRITVNQREMIRIKVIRKKMNEIIHSLHAITMIYQKIMPIKVDM